MISETKKRLFIIPLIVCICSLSMFIIILRLGWMSGATIIDSGFCELPSGKLIKEPINTWSNFGFILVGLMIAWHMMCGSFNANNNFFTRKPFISILFSSLVVCLGPCSMAKHASNTQIGGELDMVSMNLLCAFLIAYGTQRFFYMGIVYFISVFVLGAIVCEWISQLQHYIPIVKSPNNLIFAVFVILSIIMEVLIILLQQSNIQKRWGVWCLATFAISFLIWNLSITGAPLCNPQSWFQGHALWHILDAVALFFLFRFYVSEHNGRSNDDRATLTNECDYEDGLTIA